MIAKFRSFSIKVAVNNKMEEDSSNPFLLAARTGDENFVHIFLDRLKSFHENSTTDSKCLEYLETEWLNSVEIASRNKSNTEILTLLFDYYHRFIETISECRSEYTVLQLAVRPLSTPDAWDCLFREYLHKPVFRVIEILLNFGRFDVNALNAKMETVLHSFCNLILPESDEIMIDGFVRTLLNQEIDVNQKDCEGETALMLACRNGHKNIVFTLLTCKKPGYYLDLEATNNSGETALMLACYRPSENAELVAWLLNCTRKKRKYLDLDAVNNYGETALMIAKGAEKSVVIASLFFETEFLTAVQEGKTDAVKSLLQKIQNHEDTFLNLLNRTWYCNGDVNLPIYASEHFVDMTVWEEAVKIASSNEDIMKLLLQYDNVVQSQLKGESILNHILLRWTAYWSEETNSDPLPLIEALLESGTINVNVLNLRAETVLHFLCGLVDSNKPNPIEKIDTLVLKLLRHNVNPNSKDANGETVLMNASTNGNTSIVQTILKWSNETGSPLHLDATDRTGETAIMKAASRKHADIVEMLLNAGASVRLSDYCGFTVLHHALYERNSLDCWLQYGDFPRNSEELLRREPDVNLLETVEPHELYKRSRSILNEDKLKIVELLLQRSDVDVNALDCEGYSPLDVTKASTQKISPFIVEALEKKGAILNIFKKENTKFQSNKLLRKSTFFNRRENILHRLSVTTSDRNDIVKENFQKLSHCLQRALVLAKNQKGRTPLHSAVINGNKDLAEMLISFGCKINETDNYGWTPLHYAKGDEMVSLLVERGAAPTISDSEGITVKNMTDQRQNISGPNRFYVSGLLVERWTERQLCHDNHTDSMLRKNITSSIIAKKLWSTGNYACRNRSTKRFTQEVQEFIENLSVEIGRHDPRFEIRVMLVGSGYDGTRIDYPNEFDFDLVLTKFSQLCEASSSPELPTVFVRLKRITPKTNTEDERAFENFFDENGILIADKVNTQFSIILRNVLTDPHFVERQKNFKWNCHLRCNEFIDANRKPRLCTKLSLVKTTHRNDDENVFKQISIDIVPCIQIDGWWPDEAISNVNDDIKAKGCILVFQNPQKKYPWVPYSEHCVQISFAPAEGEMVKKSTENAKAAFMIAKQLLSKEFNKEDDTYLLKTCLLYCIEAFTPTLEKASELEISKAYLKTSLRRLSKSFWLQSIIKCYISFALNDFYPCYFMPGFSLPIGDYLKENHMNMLFYIKQSIRDFKDKVLEFEPDKISNSFTYITDFSGCLSLNSLDFCFPLSRLLNPFTEKFNRKKFISDLLDAALKDKRLKSHDWNTLCCGVSSCPFLEYFDEEDESEISSNHGVLTMGEDKHSHVSENCVNTSRKLRKRKVHSVIGDEATQSPKKKSKLQYESEASHIWDF